MTYLEITWESVESEGPGIYNEACLAGLRKSLLSAERDAKTVSVKFCANAPQWTKDSQLENEALQNHYTAAFKHTQRRLKNCKAAADWQLENL
jgi:hypothetical protein